MTKKGTPSNTLPTRPLVEVPFIGRSNERAYLQSALRRGVFPQALLLSGAVGIGKARLAGWIAQALVCEKPEAPCGACASCRFAANLMHPDIHWFFPHNNPGSSTLDHQIEEVERLRSVDLEARRADALHPGAPMGTTYYMATIHALRREAYRRPSLANRKVFVLTDADRLTLAEGDPGVAANAFLKILEEPPAGTHFILTSSAPHRILPTILSRLSEFRLSPLSESEVDAILAAAAPDLSAEERAGAAAASRGSIRAARDWLNPEWQEVRAHAIALVTAALRQNASSRYAVIKDQGVKGARGGFTELLDHIEAVVVEAASLAAGTTVTSPGDERIVQLAADCPRVAFWADATAAVIQARADAQLNAVPLLVLHTLLRSLENALASR